MAVLVSFAGQEDDSILDLVNHPRRIYALVHLTYTSGAFAVTATKSVPYQSVITSCYISFIILTFCVDLQLGRTDASPNAIGLQWQINRHTVR